MDKIPDSNSFTEKAYAMQSMPKRQKNGYMIASFKAFRLIVSFPTIKTRSPIFILHPEQTVSIIFSC